MTRTLLMLLAAPALVLAQGVHPLAGTWQGALRQPTGDLGFSVVLEEAGGTWRGRITIPDQRAVDVPLSAVEVGPATVSFRLDNIPGRPRFAAKLGAEGRLEGTLTQASLTLPFTLSRPGAAPVSAPAPKAPEAPASLDRPLAFPGFNAFPLKGSVRPAGPHPYFAVMVAGSGPTDRDWANPLIPVPSHGGRDFAGWLQVQGLGSLRYDKRFIGSRDPKLDISLDAQVGDIKAALKAARGLPEAKGKKVLLVGHSEGALLALLAAGEADAALFLAMPGLSMGRLITEQVKGQLEAASAPVELKTANLAYLELVLESIRGDKPLPEAGVLVAPGLVNLGQGLARPESRGFVRATLDLDPWPLAARVPVPCAVAWGDRDIQTWRPAALPEGFRGTVIEIPGANHLFKRETRAREGLAGSAAGSAYGDDTPLADLAPLAAWLKGLP